MAKRLIPAIVIAIVVPILFILLRNDEVWIEDKIYSDSEENYYIIYQNDRDIMIAKFDINGKIIGEWRRKRTDGRSVFRVDAMSFAEGEVYCAITEMDATNFMLVEKTWLTLDFGLGTDRVLHNISYEDTLNEYATAMTVTENGLYSISTLHGAIQAVDVFGKSDIMIEIDHNCLINYAAMLPNGELLFTDILNNILILSTDGIIRNVYHPPVGSFSTITVDDDGWCYIYDWSSEKWLWSDSTDYLAGIDFASSEPPYPTGKLPVYTGGFPFERLLVWIAIGLAAGAMWFLLMSMKKVSILLKLSGVIILSLVLCGVVLFAVMWDSISATHLKTKIDRTVMSGRLLAAEIDSERLMEIDWENASPEGYLSELSRILEYQNRANTAFTTNLQNQYEEITLDYDNYYSLYIINEGEIYTGICDHYPANIPFWVIGDSDIIPAMELVANGKIPVHISGINEKHSDWVLAISPIRNSRGEIVALVETGISKQSYISETHENLWQIITVISAFEVALGGLILIMLRIMFIPLKRLQAAVVDVGRGNFEVELAAGGRDEIAEVSLAFNRMASEIRVHTENLSSLNDAYLRFFPLEMLSAMGKTSILSVTRGDFNKSERYLLHLRLTNFREIIDRLPSNEIFKLVNYLSENIIEQVIAQNGVVESYNGEDYICLFDNADIAYHAGIKLIRMLRELQPNAKNSVVIVKDEVLLGIVGHEKRLSTIMFSPLIALSEKLSRIASKCGVRLLLTSDIVLSRPYPSRRLGDIEDNGKVYLLSDYFEGDEVSSYLAKSENIAVFEEMVASFQQHDWEKSKSLALTYLKTAAHTTQDRAAVEYLFLCEHNLINPRETKELGSIAIV